MFRSLAAAAALSLASLAPAQAVTVTQAATPGVAIPNISADSTVGTYFENVTDPGLISGVRRSPWEGTALDGSVYSSITGTATFLIGGTRTSVSLVWGSPDDYNWLNIYSGATLLASINGTAVGGCCGVNVANSLVTISGMGAFDRIEFVSTTAAFEFANLAAIPLPAGGLLLVGAMGALAILRRRAATA